MDEQQGTQQPGTRHANPGLLKAYREDGPQTIAATIHLTLTLRGTGKVPSLATIAFELEKVLSVDGLTVSVSHIERTDR